MGNNISKNEEERKDGSDRRADEGGSRSEGETERRVIGKEMSCDLLQYGLGLEA